MHFAYVSQTGDGDLIARVRSLETGGSVYEIVLQKGYLSQDELEDLLKPENMTRPRYLHR